MIEHRAGSKICDIDALSRHVGTILQEGILDMKNILHEQAKGAFCNKQNPGTCQSRKEYFLDIDDIMYKRPNDNH